MIAIYQKLVTKKRIKIVKTTQEEVEKTYIPRKFNGKYAKNIGVTYTQMRYEFGMKS